MNPHRTHRPDNNRDEIVAEFERLGWKVFNTGMVGEGFPDLVVAKEQYRGQTYSESLYYWQTRLVEIKNGDKPYTPKEQKFMDENPGLVKTVRSIQDVNELFG